MTRVEDVSPTERRVHTVGGEVLHLHSAVPGGPTVRLELVLQGDQLVTVERTDGENSSLYTIHVYRPGAVVGVQA